MYSVEILFEVEEKDGELFVEDMVTAINEANGIVYWTKVS
jgi:hypothetical protein